MAKGPKRESTRESFWRRLIRGQAGSGMSIRAWCRRHSVQEASFYWWRRELAHRDGDRRSPRGRAVGRSGTEWRNPDRAKPVFVPVRLAENSPTGPEAEIEILLAHDQRVRIRGPVSRQTLADVLAVLMTPSGEAEE
jgi:hypothetical protein